MAPKPVYGAQYSPTLDKWIGWAFDGKFTTYMEPRTTREKALETAAAQHHRRFHTETPAEVTFSD